MPLPAWRVRNCSGRLLSDSWQTSLPSPLARLGHPLAVRPSRSAPELADASGATKGACGVELALAVSEHARVMLPHNAWLASSGAASRKPRLTAPEEEFKAWLLAAGDTAPSTVGVTGCEASAYVRKETGASA